MEDVDEKSATTHVFLPSRKKQLLSSAMKRTTEWIISQEVPSELTVQVGEITFSLHKFPLISKCGYIRTFVLESNDSDLLFLEIPDVPGGAEAFELAAKFCYGVNFEITLDNVAMLRCVAEYLEMTEDYASGNLVSRTEDYLDEVALQSLPGSISVLNQASHLIPMAEKVNLINRCVDSIAYLAYQDPNFSSSGRIDGNHESLTSVTWWAEDLTLLRIDVFQRVLMAMKTRGLKQYSLGPILMLYAQKSLRGLDMYGRGRKKIDPKQEHEKRVILETIVSLLPREKYEMSVSFLSMLLRAAMYLETTVACRLDLEKRMGLQLVHAVLDDLMIPSFSCSGDNTIFDVDTVQRILMNYLEYVESDNNETYSNDLDFTSRHASELQRVGKLMENYLAEIASDQNLTVLRFTSLGEMIPEQARVIEDGMYRAIDIYLKAHPTLSDLERKKVCSLMDCHKLSREACAHAAQNDRLPAQVVVQVLYYEQQRIHDSMGDEFNATQYKMNLHSPRYPPVQDDVSSLRRENDELKLELVKMKMRLKELEKPAKSYTSSDKPPLPKKSFMNSVSKKLGRLYTFVRAEGMKTHDDKAKIRAKVRRHSIS